MEPINWHEYLEGDPVPGLHFHGFLWRGAGGLLESYKQQINRNPGRPEFMASDLPPEAVRHYLLKANRVAGTFRSAEEAAAWMREQWDEQAPRVTHEDPDNTRGYHEVVLSHGRETVWAWWYPDSSSNTKVHVTAVPCPFHWPEDPAPMPCPQPPAW
ncbi:hypothetical protein LN042_25885 [Kitasatospora sp. RB6PN24]|uniref:hypothetical protein n=1 Tax=Kitasatospora humi TaxID=2893891 RepID=UPI001E4B3255|nr:hypothetical protein [Kitasatospora humi]MCC9310458.1 hypothetical protein [Kitasatospora humi]